MRTNDTERSSAGFETVCAWCGIASGNSAVKGTRDICENCRPRVIIASELTSGQVGNIPLGLLQLDASGRVLDHENPRYRSVTGRNLFTEVIPFAGVMGLREQFRDFLGSGEAGRVFNLTFRSEQGEVHVRVFFGRVCAEIALVRIKMEPAA